MMASTSFNTTTVPPLQHHDRYQKALLQSRLGTCQFIQSRKKLNRSLRTARAPGIRWNAAVGFEAETSGRISFYELLEVPREVSFDEVKRAYRRLALRYHPDVSSPHLANENARKFMEVQEAYRTLSDPRSREVYDRELYLGGLVSTSTSARWPQNEEVYDRACWRRQWQDQLEKLSRRSMARDLYSKVNSGLSRGAKR